MPLKGLFKNRKKNVQVSLRVDRHHNLLLSRRHDQNGFNYYALENKTRKQTIIIHHYIFERFRGMFRDPDLSKDHQPRSVLYRQNQLFSFSKDKSHDGSFVLKECEPASGSTGYLNLSAKAVQKLPELLFHPDLQEPHDLLRRIVAYHGLFQFSFTDRQESMTSDLSLRKEILSHLQSYVPRNPEVKISGKSDTPSTGVRSGNERKK